MPDDLHIPTAAGGHAYRASYRARPQGGDGMTRNLLIAAAGLGGVLLAGMGGWALLGRRPAEVPVIEADERPVRVKPDNAGGLQVAGADDPAGGDAGNGQGMAPRAEAPAPQALRAQMQASSPTPQAQAPMAAQPVPALPGSGASPLPDTPRPVGRGAAAVPSTAASARPAPAAVAPAAASAAPAASPAAGSTLVQLAAVDTEQAAQAEWQRLSKRMPDALGDRRLVLQRADRDGKAVWRIRTGGFTDMADATAFCTRLRAKGASCTIAAF